MLRLKNIRLSTTAGEGELIKKCARTLGVRREDIVSLRVLRRALDARKKSDIHYNCTVAVELARGEDGALSRCRFAERYEPETYSPPVAEPREVRPVVAGFGPAGMFAALALAEGGLRPIVLERGRDADARRETVGRFWKTGELDPECNVQFGEGGAGAFSDGKLNTGINDGRIAWILSRLHEFGAPESIICDAHPHVGTDILGTVVKNLRRRVLEADGEVRFRHRLDGLELENGRLCALRVSSPEGEYRLSCHELVLAVGHSARDTLEMLEKAGVYMEPKGFSMGVRIEHRQEKVDLSQYGRPRDELPAAEYRGNCRLPDGESAYTFCMCPGGFVVAAASEKGGVVTNGMSYSGRSGENANSALLVTLHPEDFPYPGPLGGVRWQRELEHAAFVLGGGNYRAPAQMVGGFLGLPPGEGTPVSPTYRPGVTFCDLHDLLPEKICSVLERAIPELGKKLGFFNAAEAVMTAPETRSSSPVRITRGPGREAVATPGLFPCGEGAGYAGGIVSAAVDGLKTAEAVISRTCVLR